MTTVGRLMEFDASSDSVAAYVERAQLFFEANSIEEGKQVAVFLSAIGPKTYVRYARLTVSAVRADMPYSPTPRSQQLTHCHSDLTSRDIHYDDIHSIQLHNSDSDMRMRIN